jgi:hypothetical protein
MDFLIYNITIIQGCIPGDYVMILDIDIRVSNDNGVQVHQFTKHFDSKFEGKSGIDASNNSISRDFEDFLAEFLSGSGRVIRSQLITEQTAAFSDPKVSDPSCGNIEYTLKLGDSQSVTGKIPLDKLFRLSELSKLTKQTESENNDLIEISSSNPNQAVKSEEKPIESASTIESSEELILKRNQFKQPISISEIDELFRQFITTAVTRYEDSFYVTDFETSSFAKSS